ncbi:hypothetical protein PsYK624_148950 [Phanerochaete sordida]|uniref:DUF6534 domain-containing protein n=1 Tax=Phanerochaete sordida TaxID=48140 RepID=A0A9P3GNE2_9APHY|nr:hypothetical protein PsYK624_148950 [Phanerochaete sordida]
MPPVVEHNNIAAYAGPLLLGFFFNWALFGALSVQVYLYYLSFPSDRTVNKALVYIVYIIEFAQTILVTHDGFRAYAAHYGDFQVLESAQLEWIAVPVMSGVVSCAVQMFYAYRASVLANSKLLALSIAFVSLLQATAAVIQGAQAHVIGNFRDLQRAFVSCTIWLAGSAACDVLIAASMTYLLLRKDTKSQPFVSHLVQLVIETGILTAVAAIVALVLFLAVKQHSYYGCVALVLSKLYSNSLLVIFNSRISIVGGRSAHSLRASAQLRHAHAKSDGSECDATSEIMLTTRIPAAVDPMGTHVEIEDIAYTEAQVRGGYEV